MKEELINGFQAEIENIKEKFMHDTNTYINTISKDNEKKGYERNRNIIIERLQESLMWSENMKIFCEAIGI